MGTAYLDTGFGLAWGCAWDTAVFPVPACCIASIWVFDATIPQYEIFSTATLRYAIRFCITINTSFVQHSLASMVTLGPICACFATRSFRLGFPTWQTPSREHDVKRQLHISHALGGMLRDHVQASLTNVSGLPWHHRTAHTARPTLCAVHRTPAVFGGQLDC